MLRQVGNYGRSLTVWHETQKLYIDIDRIRFLIIYCKDYNNTAGILLGSTSVIKSFYEACVVHKLKSKTNIGRFLYPATTQPTISDFDLIFPNYDCFPSTKVLNFLKLTNLLLKQPSEIIHRYVCKLPYKRFIFYIFICK